MQGDDDDDEGCVGDAHHKIARDLPHAWLVGPDASPVNVNMYVYWMYTVGVYDTNNIPMSCRVLTGRQTIRLGSVTITDKGSGGKAIHHASHRCQTARQSTRLQNL